MDITDGELDGLFHAGYTVALRLLGDPGDAEDCAQEATARAIARWAKVQGYALPWVVRVATNLAIGLLRKRGRTVIGLPEAASGAVTAEVDGVALRVDLSSGLLRLPARQRQAVALRYLADLTEQDTARAMGVSVASVKAHTRRGLVRLRRSTTWAVEP